MIFKISILGELSPRRKNKLKCGYFLPLVNLLASQLGKRLGEQPVEKNGEN